MINDIQSESQYLVTLSFSVCWEDNDPCSISVKILDNAFLTKLPCNMKAEFLSKGIFECISDYL